MPTFPCGHGYPDRLDCPLCAPWQVTRCLVQLPPGRTDPLLFAEILFVPALQVAA